MKTTLILFTACLLFAACSNENTSNVPAGTDSAGAYLPAHDSASNMMDSSRRRDTSHPDTSLNHNY